MSKVPLYIAVDHFYLERRLCSLVRRPALGFDPGG